MKSKQKFKNVKKIKTFQHFGSTEMNWFNISLQTRESLLFESNVSLDIV